MPAKLYKYRSFGVRALRSIKEAEAYYAKPTSFNDPLDTDPTIEVDVGRASLEKLLFKMLTQRLDRQAAANQIHYLRYLSTEYGDYRVDPEVDDYLKRMVAQDIKEAIDRELAGQPRSGHFKIDVRLFEDRAVAVDNLAIEFRAVFRSPQLGFEIDMDHAEAL
jgi:hypothetical protein